MAKITLTKNAFEKHSSNYKVPAFELDLNKTIRDVAYPHKIYKVLMEQTGTDNPTVKVLENTLGDIVWTRDSIGQYIGTLAGAFPEDKCWFSAITASSYGDTIDGISFGRIDNNSVYLVGYSVGNGNDFNTGGVYEISLLIEVHP